MVGLDKGEFHWFKVIDDVHISNFNSDLFDSFFDIPTRVRFEVNLLPLFQGQDP